MPIRFYGTKTIIILYKALYIDLIILPCIHLLLLQIVIFDFHEVLAQHRSKPLISSLCDKYVSFHHNNPLYFCNGKLYFVEHEPIVIARNQFDYCQPYKSPKKNITNWYYKRNIFRRFNITFMPCSISPNHTSCSFPWYVISGDLSGLGNTQVARCFMSQWTKIASRASPSLGSIQYSPINWINK